MGYTPRLEHEQPPQALGWQRHTHTTRTQTNRTHKQEGHTMTVTQFADLDYTYNIENDIAEDWMLDAETWALIEACDNNN